MKYTFERFLTEVGGCFQGEMTEDQLRAVQEFYRYLFAGGPRAAFVLKGYAGTGKTTLIGALVRWFHKVGRKTILMAPTGRAAKVLSAESGYPASTIHRRIYTYNQDPWGKPVIRLATYTGEKTVFIVDEASMIGTDGDENFRSLIEDLIKYVYSAPRCRLVFVGDDAQLPPVGSVISPALDTKKLAKYLAGDVFEYTLTEVVRQQAQSLILENATMVRNSIRHGSPNPVVLKHGRGADVQVLDSYELEEELENAFAGGNSDQALVICRSNRDANGFNAEIRSRFFDRTGLLEAGDRVMVVKNNYYWKIPGNRQLFLANGDMLQVERVYTVHRFGEYSIAEVRVSLGDETPSFEINVLLNSIENDQASLSGAEVVKMRHSLIEGLLPNEPDAEQKIFQNPFYNAVQIKHAYAVTCHKSQGGQWEKVFVYQGYLPPDISQLEHQRWLYTAITRATDRLFLIGFVKDQLKEI
ncbi:MAG: AAA family ATPase [Salibacteraceae bacterium]